MNQAVRSATPVTATAPDFAAIKTRQQAAWSSGDYAVVGTTLQIVGETLCEAVDLRAGQRVLDVASRSGKGQLDQVTTIQRLNTQGGVAEGTCPKAGALLSVPYAADYAFYRKRT